MPCVAHSRNIVLQEELGLAKGQSTDDGRYEDVETHRFKCLHSSSNAGLISRSAGNCVRHSADNTCWRTLRLARGKLVHIHR